jgi:hypothetical protein
MLFIDFSPFSHFPYFGLPSKLPKVSKALSSGLRRGQRTQTKTVAFFYISHKSQVWGNKSVRKSSLQKKRNNPALTSVFKALSFTYLLVIQSRTSRKAITWELVRNADPP